MALSSPAWQTVNLSPLLWDVGGSDTVMISRQEEVEAPLGGRWQAAAAESPSDVEDPRELCLDSHQRCFPVSLFLGATRFQGRLSLIASDCEFNL